MMQRSFSTFRPSTPERNLALALIGTAEVARPLSVLYADKNGLLGIYVQRTFEGRPTTSALSPATSALREGSFFRTSVSGPTEFCAPSTPGVPNPWNAARARDACCSHAMSAAGFTRVRRGCTRTTETRARSKRVTMGELQGVAAALAGPWSSSLGATQDFQSRSLSMDNSVSAVAVCTQEKPARQARRCGQRGRHASARRSFAELLLPVRGRGPRRHGPGPLESAGLAKRVGGRDPNPKSACLAHQDVRFVEQRLKESRDQTGGDRYLLAHMYGVESGPSNATIDVLSQNTWQGKADLCNAHSVAAAIEGYTIFNQASPPGAYRCVRPAPGCNHRADSQLQGRARWHVKYVMNPPLSFPSKLQQVAMMRSMCPRCAARRCRALRIAWRCARRRRVIGSGQRRRESGPSVFTSMSHMRDQSQRHSSTEQSVLADFNERTEAFRARDIQRSRLAPPIHR